MPTVSVQVIASVSEAPLLIAVNVARASIVPVDDGVEDPGFGDRRVGAVAGRPVPDIGDDVGRCRCWR